MVRSPSPAKSTTPRIERPMRRWISTVRPSGRPRETSRCLRSPVEAGSIEYSAVTQPRPAPLSQRGTSSTAEAVQITRVPPAAIRTEPVAVRMKPVSMRTGRSSSCARPSDLTVVLSVAPLCSVADTAAMFAGPSGSGLPARRRGSVDQLELVGQHLVVRVTGPVVAGPLVELEPPRDGDAHPVRGRLEEVLRPQ